MDLGIAGKKALVTGSYRGTGLVIAKALMAEGVDVFVHGFDTESVTNAIDEIGGGQPAVGDIRTDAGAAEVLAATGDDIEILVNNYGTAAGDVGTRSKPPSGSKCSRPTCSPRNA